MESELGDDAEEERIDVVEDVAVDSPKSGSLGKRFTKLFSREKPRDDVKASDTDVVAEGDEQPSRPTVRQRISAVFSRKSSEYVQLGDDEENAETVDKAPKEKSPSLRERAADKFRDFRRSTRRTDSPLLDDTDDVVVVIDDGHVVDSESSPSRLGQMASAVKSMFSRSNAVAPSDSPPEVEGSQGAVHVAGHIEGARGKSGGDDGEVQTADPRSRMKQAQDAAAGIVSRLKGAMTPGGSHDATGIRGDAKNKGRDNKDNRVV